MNRLTMLVATAVLVSGCGMFGRDEMSSDFDRVTKADEASVLELKARTNLAAIESALADFVKAEHRVPAKLTELVPKYIAGIPSIDLPACGAETENVQYYDAGILRDGVVDGARLRGTGRWGYVHDRERVVVFIDCLKPTGKKTPWYQERGVY